MAPLAMLAASPAILTPRCVRDSGVGQSHREIQVDPNAIIPVMDAWPRRFGCL